MKKIFVPSLFALLSVGAQAEGYVGASIGRGKLPFDCAQDAVSCKQSVNVFKLYAGTRLKESHQINLGVGRIDALEVGFLRTNGKAAETRMVEQTYYLIDPDDPFNNGPATRMAPTRRLVSLDALVVAPVLRIDVMSGVDVFVKAGAAIVTSSVKTTILEPKTNPKGEVSLKSESQTKLKPYLAAGASYTVMPGVKVVGSADWFSYSVEGVSGTARALSLGAEVAF